MKYSLHGEWSVDCLSRPDLINVPMLLPGDIHTALFEAKRIPEPYWSDNEKRVQWVGECEWLLYREIELSTEQCNGDALNLVVEYLDTVAEVRINHQLVLCSKNMFIGHCIDILSFVCSGLNRIEIKLKRADLYTEEAAKTLPFPIPWAEGNNKIPHMNLLRKAQCHTGWDWGICLMAAGIYGEISLERIDNTLLSSVQTEQYWSGEDCAIDIKVSYRVLGDKLSHASVEFNGHKKTLLLPVEHTQQSIRFTVKNARRWWPAGYGEQYLYDLCVSNSTQTLCKRIGLRELRLVTEKDAVGTSMFFEVNNVPIMAKGANWIPLDAMPGRNNDMRYRDLLTSAVDANMNMIRVWGGGIYEHHIFYELCDELGLMVWQDLMFACALYPSTPEFVSEVTKEVGYQVDRLRDHACIVLWCGDNEVIGAIGWYPVSQGNRERYVVNYDRLNRSLGETVAKHDASRQFWASSPCNGELDFGDAWHNDNKGDMHFWDVWHSGNSIEAYTEVNPRFCSEFGYQSWPSLPTIKQFLPASEWNVSAPSFESHQKNNRGNSIITEMFTRYFRFPNGFENMLYLSQVQQAMAIKTASEYWRAIKPINRGILYWQLNDCWPVSSWSSLEYDGRWKQLHYQAKRFFAPQLVTFVKTDTCLTLRLINDTQQSVLFSGAVTCYSLAGDVLDTCVIETEVEADGNTLVWSKSLSVLSTQANDSFFSVQLSDGQQMIRNTYLTVKPKEYRLLPPNIKYRLSEVKGKITVRLVAERPAFYVHLEYAGSGRFSDSSFTLLAGQPRIIDYQGKATLAELTAGLKVYDLYHSYSG